MVYSAPMPKTPHLTLRLKQEDRERLERIARRLGDVTLSAAVRHLIRRNDPKEKRHA